MTEKKNLVIKEDNFKAFFGRRDLKRHNFKAKSYTPKLCLLGLSNKDQYAYD
jgi:hypothetical protein